jgi:hypothetical protein
VTDSNCLMQLSTNTQAQTRLGAALHTREFMQKDRRPPIELALSPELALPPEDVGRDVRRKFAVDGDKLTITFDYMDT